jgi:UDP-N-acetylglucosamine 2-epimerase (hydrolysing)
VTGMHLIEKYGTTVDEIYKSGFKNVYKFANHKSPNYMEKALARTILGFSTFVAKMRPDLIIVHGDRVEALAGAIVGSINNILVAHVEGGEVSGTIDELIRHAITKLSHIHFAANDDAKKRLIQLGELPENVFVIGSPDLDLMNPKTLPKLCSVKKHYDIPFDSFAIAMFHPVTTEFNDMRLHAKEFVKALLDSGKCYVVVQPNNDRGSDEIMLEYEIIESNPKFRMFPSLRFESFLTLLNASEFIIGNSSAGVREAPFYGVPTIDIGTRQKNRVKYETIYNCGYDHQQILSVIYRLIKQPKVPRDVKNFDFGNGDSCKLFLDLILSNDLWLINHQKQFQEL